MQCASKQILYDATSALATADADRYSSKAIHSSGALAGFRPLTELEAGFDLGAATKGPGFLGECGWGDQAGTVFRCADSRWAPWTGVR